MTTNANQNIQDLNAQFESYRDKANLLLEEFDRLLCAYQTLQKAVSFLFFTNLMSIIVIISHLDPC